MARGQSAHSTTVTEETVSPRSSVMSSATRWCLGVLVLGLALAMAAVPAAADTGEHVAISVHASADDGVLHIRGTATVPDGALIIYAAYRAGDPKSRARGYARVADQAFAADVDVSHWPPGMVHVDAHFQVLLPGRTQPDKIVARYGVRGERMTGKDVVQGGDSFRAAVASTVVTLR